MGEVKHTPGPWRIVDGTGGDLYVRDVGGVITFCAKPMRWEGQPERYESEMAEYRANARLISAAPDMLEALETIMFEFGPGTMSDEAFGKAVAAISKAKGETT